MSQGSTDTKVNQSDQKREKRQATSVDNDDKKKKNRCYLALVADHKFYQEIGNSNGKLTTAYMVNIYVLRNISQW